MKLLVCFFGLMGLAWAQHLPTLSFAIQPPPLQQPASLGFSQFGGGLPDYSHRAVILNSQMEATLPEHLKNPFYRNPRIAQALAKESWFGPGETPVSVREAEKIPRERIVSVLKNAGLARRR